MLNKIIVFFCVLFVGCSHNNSVPWIDYDNISKLQLGLSQKDIISTLGNPILILGDAEDGDEKIYYYYNYHVHSFVERGENLSDKKLKSNLNPERKTLLKFTFVDDALVSWEEDKLTLSMSLNGGSKPSSFSYYASLLLNILLLIKII